MVAIRHRDDDALVQADDDFDIVAIGERVEEADLHRARVREHEPAAGRAQLFDHGIAACSGERLALVCGGALECARLGRLDYASGGGRGHAGRHESA